MLKTLKAVLGFDGVGNSALKIVDKLAGTDWTPQQQAEFVLKHAEVTKHQSPTRRVLAFVIAAEQFMLVLVWTKASIVGHMAGVPGAIDLANAVLEMLASNVNMAMNGILAFYFLAGMKK